MTNGFVRRRQVKTGANHAAKPLLALRTICSSRCQQMPAADTLHEHVAHEQHAKHAVNSVRRHRDQAGCRRGTHNAYTAAPATPATVSAIMAMPVSC